MPAIKWLKHHAVQKNKGIISNQTIMFTANNAVKNVQFHYAASSIEISIPASNIFFWRIISNWRPKPFADVYKARWRGAFSSNGSNRTLKSNRLSEPAKCSYDSNLDRIMWVNSDPIWQSPDLTMRLLDQIQLFNVVFGSSHTSFASIKVCIG